MAHYHGFHLCGHATADDRKIGTHRVRIDTVKELICYCFSYSADDIERDYRENGESTIMKKIQMEKKFGNCRCATKNPKGK